MKDGLEDFVSNRFGDHDEALFVDFAEVPRITRGWRTGSAETLFEVRNVTAMGFQSPVGPARGRRRYRVHAPGARRAPG